MKRARIIVVFAALLCLALTSYATDDAIVALDRNTQTIYAVVVGDHAAHAVVTWDQSANGQILPGNCTATCPTELWAPAALSPRDRNRGTEVPIGSTNIITAHVAFYQGETWLYTIDVSDELVSMRGSTGEPVYGYNSNNCNPEPNPPELITIGMSWCMNICHGTYLIPVYCEAPGYNPNLLELTVSNGCSPNAPDATHCNDAGCAKIDWSKFRWTKLVTPPTGCPITLMMTYCSTGQPGCICIWRSDFRLPVEFSSFDARGADSRVIVNWSTASETDVQSFIVTRSDNPESGFRSVHSATPSNNASGHAYQWVDTDVENGHTYYYRLHVMDANGTHVFNNGDVIVTSSATPRAGVAPDVFELAPNYPNPFNSQTVFNFTLPQSGFTTLKIYDLLGRSVATVMNGYLKNGTYTYNWSAENLPTGVYMYTLTSGQFTQTRKLLYMK